VLSDSGDDMTYNSYKSGRPLAKLLDNFATGVARRRLDFFFRGRPVCGDDTPAALQMPAHAQLDARAPARVKRSFQLGASAQGSLANAAAAGSAAAASANGSDSSGSGSPSAPPFKRAKSDPLSSPPASSAAAAAAASSVGASAAEAAASSSPPVAYIAPWSELQLGTCEFVVRQQTRAPLDQMHRSITSSTERFISMCHLLLLHDHFCAVLYERPDASLFPHAHSPRATGLCCSFRRPTTVTVEPRDDQQPGVDADRNSAAAHLLCPCCG
jgi:hypothetical protein